LGYDCPLAILKKVQASMNIFDIDGTLTDTKKVEDKCFMKAFEKTFELDITSQKWSDLKNVTDWGITEEIIEREFNRKPFQQEYDLMISNFIVELKTEREKDKNQFNEVSGAKDFFYFLKDHTDYKLGIATGSWEKSAKIKLDTIGINPDQVAFSNSDYHKSREDITKHSIQQLKDKFQVEPTQIIYFGDGVWDFKTCRNLGIKFIGIDIEDDKKLTNLGAKTVFRNYLDVEKIMSEIKKG